MKAFHSNRFIYLPALAILLVLLWMPHKTEALKPLDEQDLIRNSPELVKKTSQNPSDDQSDYRLTPINENQLDALSPSLTAPEKVVENEAVQYLQSMDQAYRDSVCFKKCHGINDFQPADHTAKQWRLLIEENGHSLFDEIPWESSSEKEQILNYLLEKSKNTSPAPAGIGVW